MSQENASPIPSNMSNDSDPLKNQFSQEQLIDVLQTTITKLDVIVNHLNEQTIDTLPSQELLATLINSTETIANSLEPQSQASTTEMSETEIIEEKEEWEEIVEKSDYTSITDREEKIEKSEKPQDLEIQEPRSNPWTRRGILAGISIVIVAILSTSFFFLKSSLPNFEIPQIASKSSQPEVVETPPQLEVPDLPQPLQNVAPSQPKLTPEQTLIAAIQKEVTILTNQYSDGLIGKVEANFLRSRLIITLGEEWYGLSTQEQDNLATDILKRATNLDFRKLELVNKTGELIARSPMVGNDVIILQRHH